MRKKCTICKKVKPASAFYVYGPRDRHKTGSLHAACKRCEHDRRADHRRRNPAQASATARKAKIKRLFGITPEQFDAIFLAQGGVCYICHSPSNDGRNLHIDHDHETKAVRGLLCHGCNRGLGMLRDDVKRLQRAINYLQNPPAFKVLHA